jgi:hypothetical protein
MKRSLIAIAAAVAAMSLCACAALTGAGHTAVSFKSDGKGACEGTVADGKEYKANNVAIDCAGGRMVVESDTVRAFKGQAVSAKAAAVFPVTDLANIITGGGKE